MWAAVLKFLFNTPMGRGVLLGGSISIGVAISWWLFSGHYEDIGYAKCQAEHLEAVNKANADQAAKNAQNATIGSQVGQDAAAAANTVVKESDQSTADTKEVIKYVYRDPPKTAPIAPGSCVRAVDPRVQQSIERSVSEANAAGGAL